ncbi:MAG: hypothetical protein KGO49_04880 [Gammaproteobacteria bacterium]|nr:hypothetical protein [Gammaproteobacteria bacterium]
MKNTAELLYQIRGLARSVVAFVFVYQGLVQNIIINTLSQDNPTSAEAFQHASWFLYIDGLIEIGLAVWLIVSFNHKKPLWNAIGFMLLSILIEILFFDVPMGNALLIITLIALIYIDLNILDFQRERSDPRNFGKYMRVTRDRMLYEFIKRLELKDLPHLMHTLAQSRVKRHLKNRRQIKRRTELSDSPELTDHQDKAIFKKRAPSDRRQSNDELSDGFDRSE